MPVRQTAIGVFFVVSSHMFMLPERIPNGQLKAQDHQRQLTSLPRWYGLQAAVVGGSIPVANIYERRMTLGAASTLAAPSVMRQHLKLQTFLHVACCELLWCCAVRFVMVIVVVTYWEIPIRVG